MSSSVEGYQQPEIFRAGATYTSEVVDGLGVQRGKKILGTEGRPDFVPKPLRLSYSDILKQF